MLSTLILVLGMLTSPCEARETAIVQAYVAGDCWLEEESGSYDVCDRDVARDIAAITCNQF